MTKEKKPNKKKIDPDRIAAAKDKIYRHTRIHTSTAESTARLLIEAELVELEAIDNHSRDARGLVKAVLTKCRTRCDREEAASLKNETN